MAVTDEIEEDKNREYGNRQDCGIRAELRRALRKVLNDVRKPHHQRRYEHNSATDQQYFAEAEKFALNRVAQITRDQQCRCDHPKKSRQLFPVQFHPMIPSTSSRSQAIGSQARRQRIDSSERTVKNMQRKIKLQ